MATIGERIAELRKQKSMTQEEFAAIVGVSAKSVSLGGNPGKPRNPHETGGSGSWSQPIYNTFTTFAKTGRALICHPTGSKTPYRDSTPHTAFFH